ncbi:AAA family ATPase, partial [Dactylosporangium salmoneum]|uniref:AAA family ATPase n=1 Tax=Dactylosporangium salmoneum TaxID=53361 RepID=UPI0031DDCEAA
MGPATEPLLPTKIVVPEIVPRALARPELHDELWSLTDLPVTLLTGPAGAGKTQLVAAWAADAGAGDPLAWLTLDRDDRHQPARLWRHLVAALRGAGVALPAALLEAAAAGTADHRAAIAVAAALAGWDRPLLLVLDGATWLDEEQLAEVDYLVRYAGCLRLLMIARHKPRFPLHRYRLAEELGELAGADLMLDATQVRALFGLHGVELTGEALVDVLGQTRGWIAPVRLCALAMEGRPRAGVPALARHEHVVEYVSGEILGGLSEHQRSLLGSAALLDTFTADLLAAATGDAEEGRGADVVEELAGTGAFVEAADAARAEYRVHPLLGQTLRDRLGLPAEQARAVGLRAARWLAGRGDVHGAVARAVEAGAWEEAAAIVVEDLAVGELLLDGPSGPLARLLAGPPRAPRPR